MSRSSITLGFVSASFFLGIGGVQRADEPAAKPARAVIQEDAYLEAALARFNEGDLASAEELLEDYLKHNPKCPQAAQLTYQLGAIQLALDKKGKAKQTFFDLVYKHSRSPWATIALRHAFDAEDLAFIADEFRWRGIHKRNRQDHETALEIYTYTFKHFKQDIDQPEYGFKVADGCRRLGRLAESEALIGELRELKKDSDWLKLNEIWNGDAETFGRRFEELTRLRIGAQKHLALYELLELHGTKLPEAERCRALYSLAIQLALYEHYHESLEACHRLLRDHPDSDQAVDAQFLKADMLLLLDKATEARAAFLEVPRRFPDSNLTPTAKRRIASMDQGEEAREAIERMILRLRRRVERPGGGFAARLTVFQNNQKTCQLRVAWRDKLNYVYELHRKGEQSLLLACDEEATWYRLSPRQPILKSEQLVNLGLPGLSIKADPDKSDAFKFSFGFNGFNGVGAEQKIDVAPEYVRDMVDRMLAGYHLRFLQDVGAAGKERRSLHMDVRNEYGPDAARIVIDLDDDWMIRAIRLESEDGKDKYRVVVSDIVIGAEVPEDACKFSLPDNVDVKNTDAVDSYLLYAHIQKSWHDLITIAEGNYEE